MRLVRLHEAPFTDRLVAKFGLPVEGWRGSTERRRRPQSRTAARMLEEIRIGSLGVIESSTLELGPGLTVITGETGAGKTMIVTALGLLLGGRADSGAVRTGARTRPGRGRGPGRRAAPASPAAVEDAGGEVEDDRVVLARNVSAEGRSRAFVGGASVPVSVLADVAEPLVAVHGQSDQHRLLRARAQREALDRFGGEQLGRAAGRLHRPARAARARPSASSTRSSPTPGTAPARPTCSASGSARSRPSHPEPGEDATLAAEESRLGFADTLRTAAEQAREALSSEQGDPDALATTAAARSLLDGVREHDPEAGELADRLAEITYLLSDLAADVASYATRVETDPARLAAVSERRAALTALTRKYGETIDEVLAWAERSAPAAAGAGRHRRADRASCAPSSERLRARAGRRRGARCRPPAPRRPPDWPARSPTELTLLAMPHARLGIEVRQAEQPEPAPGDPRAAAGGRPLAALHRLRRRRGRARCSPRTPAASRGRSTRAPRAASCPG